jgi:calpain-15
MAGVAQGRLGNCYYLAAIASCALGQSDMLVKDLCIEEYQDVGLYGVKFFINGSWATVVVDDRIPCAQLAPGVWAPVFASPKRHSGQKEGEKEVWPMIFEKARAKLHSSYEATAGGNTADTASYLSGGTLRSVDLSNDDGADKEWERLVAVLNPDDKKAACAFLSCAVRGGQDASDRGLITGHAYSVLNMRRTRCGKRFVQVRNPWGQHEWNGAFSDKSEDWTPDLKTELGYQDEENGTFYMIWEDFCKYFHQVEICDPTALASLSSDGTLTAQVSVSACT